MITQYSIQANNYADEKLVFSKVLRKLMHELHESHQIVMGLEKIIIITNFIFLDLRRFEQFPSLLSVRNLTKELSIYAFFNEQYPQHLDSDLNRVYRLYKDHTV